MITGSILKEDRVASTIHIINNLVRGLTNKKAVKKVDTDYFVFAGNTIDTIIDMIQNKAAKTAIVVDDLGLQVINRLGQEGIRDITLVIARLPESCMPTIKYIITNTFPDIKVIIKHINEIGEHMKTDLLISNPAYGAIGANITKKLIDVIGYNEFINLLPMVDYEKADGKYQLWQHIKEKPICQPGAFIDAGISPLVARIEHTKCNNISIEEFRINCLQSDIYKKYFKANLSKIPTFTIAEQFQELTLDKTIAMPMRVTSGNHAGPAGYGKTAKSVFYQINNDLKTSVTDQENKSICCTTFKFLTADEKKYAKEFLYSKNGYAFCSKLMTGMNRDAFHKREHYFWFPRVSFTRSWTVEEILADYGYTTDEIKEIIDDLDNFQGMDK